MAHQQVGAGCEQHAVGDAPQQHVHGEVQRRGIVDQADCVALQGIQRFRSASSGCRANGGGMLQNVL